jgi:hypothetical protein
MGPDLLPATVISFGDRSGNGFQRLTGIMQRFDTRSAQGADFA